MGRLIVRVGPPTRKLIVRGCEDLDFAAQNKSSECCKDELIEGVVQMQGVLNSFEDVFRTDQEKLLFLTPLFARLIKAKDEYLQATQIEAKMEPEMVDKGTQADREEEKTERR